LENAYLRSPLKEGLSGKELRRKISVRQKKLRVKGILFDLDGTIVDSKEAYLEAAKTAFEAVGQKLPETQTALEIPKRLEQGFQIHDLVGTDIRAFLDIYLKTYYSVTKTKTKPVSNVHGTLGVLSKNAKLALITMRFVPKSAIIEELKKFGLAQFFAHIVTALDTHKPKPSPEALIAAVKALDVNLCDCVIVGDSVTDVRAGKSAGAMTVAVLSGLFSREELARENPDLILRDVTELPAFLDCIG
jgi:phosphoglycolate phosphatase